MKANSAKRLQSRLRNESKRRFGYNKAEFLEHINPFLYRAEVRLFAWTANCADSEVIETGFRKVGYDKDRGGAFE